MTAPTDILRSYGGGAVVAQLTQEMGPTDTSFTITPTTGWVQNNNSPLGTAGPFVVVIDRFTSTVEKILCSSIDLTTGVVQVYVNGGFTGRGYDANPTSGTPQSHYPNSNSSGVQTCWTSVEAQEANAAVATLFGTVGSAPTNGEALIWQSGAPVWGTAYTPPTPSAVASGELYSVSTVSIGSGVWVTLPAFGINLSGGVTVDGDALVIPAAGRYLVAGQVQISVTSDTVGLQAAVYSSTFATRILYGSTGYTTLTGNPASSFSKVIVCTAGEELSCMLEQVSATASAWPLDFVANGVTNYMSVTYLSP
jgi:hypothetical protein